MKASNSMERHCMNQSTDCGRARTTDPDTSHKAARVKRKSLRERVLLHMQREWISKYPGWTGHEMAESLDCPLNSITPRFAELVRDGSIRDSGQRRDGQIVWVLA